MSSRKLKATTLRRHKNSKPYERPKGIVATVKNWLAPSSWFSWGGTEESEDNDQGAGTSKEPFLLPPPPPGFLDGLRDHKHMMDESVSSNMEEDKQSSEEEMEDATQSLLSSSDINDQQSHSSQPLPASPQVTPPLHKPMLFNKNGIVVSSSRGAGSSSGDTTVSASGGSGWTTSDAAANSGGAASSSSPVIAERRWHTTQVHQSWKSPLTTASTGIGPAARSPPVTVDQLGSRYQTTPGFSINAFHTPSSHLSARSISRSPFRSSPYYSGRTSFGGMASKQKLTNKRARLDTSPVSALPVRQTVQARQVAQEKRVTTTSQLSQRILDTLQSLGSPLSDARKLPLRPAKRMKVDAAVKDSSVAVSSPTLPPPPVNPLLTIDPPSSSLSRPSHHNSVSGPNHHSSVSVSQSPVLSPPSSSPIKHYTPPSQSSAATYSPGSMDKGGGKMKRDKQSLHFTRQPDQQNLNPSPLPPPISLSVPSSSPFSIPFSVPSSSPLPAISTSSSSLFSRGTIQLPTAKAPSFPPPNTSPFSAGTQPTATTSTSSSFGFAKPTVLSGVAVSQTSSVKQGSPFQFSSPHHVTAASQKLSSAHQTSNAITTSPTVQLKKTQKTSSPALTPSPFKPMSVLEALKRPEYKLENIRKDAAAAPAAATIDLTSDDDEEEEVSVSKEKESVSTTSASSIASSIQPLALPSTTLSSSSWTCDDCWVSNKDNSSSCVACGATKPGNKPASSNKSASVFSGFSSSNNLGSSSLNNPVPSSSNNQGSTSSSTGPASVPPSNNQGPPSSSNQGPVSWTCDDCWVSNKDTSLTCVACGAKKPGSNPTSSAATTVLGGGATSASGGLSLSSGTAGGLKLPSGGLLFGNINTSTTSNTSTTASMVSGGFKLPTTASGLLSSSTSISSSISPSTGSSSLGGNGGFQLSSSTATGGLLLGGSGGFQLSSSSSASPDSSNVLGGDSSSSGGSFKLSTVLSGGGGGFKLSSSSSAGSTLGSGGGGITLSSPLLTSMKPSQPSISSPDNGTATTSLSAQAAPSLFGTTAKTSVSDTSQASTQLPSLSQFAPPAGNWSCDSCLVSNKSDSEQCVACNTPKPGAKMSVPSAGQLGSGTTLFGGGIKLSTSSGGGFNLTGGLQLGAKPNTSGGLQLGSGLPVPMAMNGSLMGASQSEQEKATSLLPLAPAFNATSNQPSSAGSIQLGTGQSAAISNAPFSFTGSLVNTSSAAASVLSNLTFSIPPPPVTTTSPQPSPPSIQVAAAPPSFIFSGSKQPPAMTTSSSGGGLFGPGPSSILPTAAGGSGNALGIGAGFFGNKTTTSAGTSNIFQPPPIASTPAPSFNFPPGPPGPAPFTFGQQTPATNPPSNPAAPPTLFSSTPKINFAAPSGGSGIFSQLAEQSQSGSSSMFQFSGSSSSLPQQPLGMGSGLPNTGNPFSNAGSAMQFGASDGAAAAAGSMFSAGIGAVQSKRVIKKAARRKK